MEAEWEIKHPRHDLMEATLKTPIPPHQQAVDAPETPPGWWSLPGLSGSLAGILKVIGARQDIPRHWRDVMIQDIAEKCGDQHNFVDVHAHYHLHEGQATFHYHAKPSTKLI